MKELEQPSAITQAAHKRLPGERAAGCGRHGCGGVREARPGEKRCKVRPKHVRCEGAGAYFEAGR